MKTLFKVTALIPLVSLAHAQSETESPNSEPARIERPTPPIRFESENKLFSFEPRFRMQNQFTYTDEDPESSRSDTAQAQVRRFRIRARGHALGPQLRYDFQLSFTRQDQDFDNTGVANVLRDAMVHFDVRDDLTFSFGQTKLAGNRQRVISSGEQQFVDRGLVNRVFNLDRDIGFFATYRLHPLIALRGSLTGGEGRGVSARNSGVNSTLRLESLPFGAFKDGGENFEGDLAFEEQSKLALGFTYNFNDQATRQGGAIGPELNQAASITTLIADAVFKYRGFSAYLEYANRTSTRIQAVETRTNRQSAFFSGQGYSAQAGYFVSTQHEVSARYAEIVPHSALTNGYAETQRQTTLGWTHYLNHHRVKIQADVTRSVAEGNANLISSQLRAGSFWLGRFQIELGI